MQTINVGITNTSADAGFYIADAKGYFKDEGLNVKLIPFPSAAERTQVGSPNLQTPFQFGWLYLNLNSSVTPAGRVPPEDPNADQAWVYVTMQSQGRFSVGFDAVRLDSACSALHFLPGNAQDRPQS